MTTSFENQNNNSLEFFLYSDSIGDNVLNKELEQNLVDDSKDNGNSLETKNINTSNRVTEDDSLNEDNGEDKIYGRGRNNLLIGNENKNLVIGSYSNNVIYGDRLLLNYDTESGKFFY